LRGHPDADRIALVVAAAIGLSGEAPAREETFWGIRVFLEGLAVERPLVVVVEDIHWAEPTLLDLIEHIVDSSRKAPLVMLCAARPELLDARAGWGRGKPTATTIQLKPLPAERTSELIDALPGGRAVPESIRDRISTAAEGNPLFVEEMLAMLRDDELLVHHENGTWRASASLEDVGVPASITALLSARLERLPLDERAVAQLASVVGRVFEQVAVEELASAALRPTVGPSLRALARKELIRRERLDGGGRDRFKFRHILIRDAAYEALSKAARAGLHERFADYVERTTGARVTEHEEILGHHLGSAFRYRTDLAESGRHVERLAERARERLASAGRRASERGDVGASIRLLAAAAAVSPVTSAEGRDLRVDLGRALGEAGRFDDAEDVVREALEASRAAGDVRSQLRVRVLRLELASIAGTARAGDAPFLREVEVLEPLVEAEGDIRTLAEFLDIKSNALWEAARLDEAIAAMRRAGSLAGQAGMGRRMTQTQLEHALNLLRGSAPVNEVLASLEELLRATDSGFVRARILAVRAVARAMEGDTDGARTDTAESRRVLIELAQLGVLADLCHEASWVERLSGDHEEEVRVLDRRRTLLQEAGIRESGGLIAARRAHALAKLGRTSEARAELAIAETDHWPVIDAICHLVRGRLHAAAGRADDALKEADLAERTCASVPMFRNLRSEVLIDVAWIAARLGQGERARAAAGEALRVEESRGNAALAAQARRVLAQIADDSLEPNAAPGSTA
jgi:tetratricopeptide (TPR) repeat protein